MDELKKTGKPSIPHDEAERVRGAIRRLIETDPRFPNKARFGAAIGRSGSAVSQLLAGSNLPSLETVGRIAAICGVTEYELRKGTATKTSSAFEVALAYWPGRWSNATIAKGRKLATLEEHTPQGWTLRLDEVRDEPIGIDTSRIRPSTSTRAVVSKRVIGPPSGRGSGRGT